MIKLRQLVYYYKGKGSEKEGHYTLILRYNCAEEKVIISLIKDVFDNLGSWEISKTTNGSKLNYYCEDILTKLEIDIDEYKQKDTIKNAVFDLLYQDEVTEFDSTEETPI